MTLLESFCSPMPNPSNQRISLYLIERQELSRTGFRLIFEMDEGIQIIGESDDLETAMADVIEKNPCVVLVRADVIDKDVEQVRQLKEKLPDTNVLVLSDNLETLVVSQFIGANASGYCSRNVNVQNLLVAVRAVSTGGMWFGPAGAQIIRGVLRGDLNVPSQFGRAGEYSGVPASLTEREAEILKRVSQGLTNQQIAERLHLSVETVKTYIRRIMDKSSIRSRRELVVRYHGTEAPTNSTSG